MRGMYPLHDQDNLRYPSCPLLFEQGQSSWSTNEHLGVAKSYVFKDLVPPCDQLRGLLGRTRVDWPGRFTRHLVPVYMHAKSTHIAMFLIILTG